MQLWSRILAGMCIIVAIIVTINLKADEEQCIQGKRVSELLKQLRSDNRGLLLRAARALIEAPANLRETLVTHLIEVLKSERENDRFSVAQVLGEYESGARKAVSYLPQYP